LAATKAAKPAARRVLRPGGPKPVALVFGAGPEKGLGAALARRFADEGHSVVVVGRTRERLESLTRSISARGGTAIAHVGDATSPADVAAAFDSAEARGAPDLVVYNVGANRAAGLLETSPERFEARGRGSILFTGATASVRARPPFAAFAAAKAALRAVAQALAREFGPRGLHVAHFIVDGVIDGEYAATQFPDFFAARGESGRLDPAAIAEAYWAVHRQPASAWSHEIDLRPFAEPF